LEKIFGGKEDNTVSKSREAPPQTASDNQDWLTGWALLLPPLGRLGWDLN